MNPIWSQEPFQNMVIFVFAVLFLVGILSFFFRKKAIRCKVAWVSARSWIFAAPFIAFVISLPFPYTLFCLAVISIYTAKTFFCMVGMYHLKAFVLTCYTFIALAAYCIQDANFLDFSFLPIAFLICVITISLIKRSAIHILQYTALSLLTFMLFGWCFMHLGWILQMEKGVYMALSVYILAEVYSLVFLSGRKSSSGFSYLIGASLCTFVLSWGLHQFFLPRDSYHWVFVALGVCVLGTFTSLTFNFIRRDLTIKMAVTPFILGRDNILTRVEKIVFIAPVYYYILMEIK